MTRSELIKKITKLYPNHSASTINKIVRIVFNELSNALIKEDKIEIRRFGSFRIRKRNPKTVKNPTVSIPVEAKDRNIIYFRTSKEFKDSIN